MILKRFGLWLLLMLAVLPAGAAVPVVRVVGPDPVAGEVQRQLAERAPGLDVRRDDVPARLVVAVGARAFRDALVQPGSPPVVGVALTRDSYRAALRDAGDNATAPHTAVYWEPDPVQQLRLARLVMPSARRVGILPGTMLDESLLAAIRAECARLGLTPVTGPANAVRLALPQQVSAVLADSDFLLGIEGSDVFAPANAKTVLLTAYRHGKPVIGPTGPWVDAGSMASLASGMPAAVETLAAWLPALLEADPLPPPRYPDRYTVATNPQVARSLSFTLPTAARIDAFLRGSGGVP